MASSSGFDVRGKVCLITGSARGLGKEFARQLLAGGAKVCISDVNDQLGLATRSELEETYGSESVTFCRLDVTDRQQWEAIFEHCRDVFMDDVQVLVNNAGIGDPKFGKELILKTNLIGPTVGSDIFIERVSISKGGKGGRIVNVSSATGLFPGVSSCLGKTGYAISKTGLLSCTREIARCGKRDIFPNPKSVEELDGVKAFAVCPSFVDTDLLGEDREYIKRRHALVKAEEVGEAVIQLLADDINGTACAVFPGLPKVRMLEMNTAFVWPVLLPMIKIASVMGLTGDTVNAGTFFLLFLLLLVLFGATLGKLLL